MNPWNPAIVLCIWLNHNINFILLNIKALILIYYITNYVIKANYNQYQRVIVVAIVKKVFANHNKNLTSISTNYTPTPDKFALELFN